MSALDKKDAKLAALLQIDGRMPNARLAEQLHLSEPPAGDGTNAWKNWG